MKSCNLFLILFKINIIVLISSCDRKIDVIPVSDVQTLPSVTVKDLNSILTDSGKIELTMSAPLMEQYDNKEEPFYEFRSGIRVIFFDGKKDPTASVTAKYAKYTDTESLWELRDSVIVVDDKKVMLETELLFWNQATDRIYTDRFVKITNGDEVMTGLGLESDSHLRTKKIKKVWAIIYLNDEE